MIIGITSYKVDRDPNLYQITKDCISSCKNQSIPSKIVIADDSSSFKNEDLDGVELFSLNNGNLAKSLNFLCRNAFYTNDRDAILIINNDIVLDKDAIKNLRQYLLDYSKSVFITGVERCGHEFHPFSAFCLPRKTFEVVGPFDERFTFNYTDVDYTMRIKEYCKKSGMTHSLRICDDFTFHHERGSTNRIFAEEIIERDLIDANQFEKKYGFVLLPAAISDAYKVKYGKHDLKYIK